MRDLRNLVSLLAVSLSIVLPGPARAATDLRGIPILLYHRVGDSRYPSTNVSLKAFRRQMELLRDGGHHVVSTAALEDHLLAEGVLPDKPVVIQFDDGYRSVLENAVPVLREFGYPFTVFVPTDAIDRGYGDYLTWKMAGEVVAAGGTIASHGLAHLRLAAPVGGAGPPPVEKELRGSRAALLERGHLSPWIAYPYGEYTGDVLAAAREAGYRLGFAQDPGTASRQSDPFAIPRYAVVGGMADLATFRERLGYRPLVLVAREPAPGLVSGEEGIAVRGCVGDPGSYTGGSANLFVSELGRLEAHWDARNGCVEARVAVPLQRRLNRVLVSLQERASGRYGLASWVLIRGEGAL